MQKSSQFLAIFVFILGCSETGKPAGDTAPSLTAADANLTLQQNSSASVDLGSAAAVTLEISRPPLHGKIKIQGMMATYEATEPLYNGTDSFGYKIHNARTASNEATVNVTVTPLAPTTTVTYVENYAAQAYALAGWKSFSSRAGHTSSTVTSFATTTYNGVTAASRHFGIYGDAASYAGDAAYTSLFGVLPVDGAADPMKDWPWKAELIHIPQCGVDVTLTAKIHANLGQAPMVALLLNYRIEQNATAQNELTGYHVLINSGGGSLTLSRFDHADSLATAYLDRWPNTTYGSEALANPVTYGPYKGWNYRNGAWPAGGNVGNGSDMLVAVRYQYDTSTGNTTISYEARAVDGTDSTPGTWDIVVNLTGADSLPPSGDFGLMPMNYHTVTGLNTTDFDVAEYKLVCTVP